MSIKIWLGDLGAYNSGVLRGEWLDLPIDPETLSAKVSKYTNGGQGDYFIADHELPDYLPAQTVREFSNPQELNELAEKLDELRDDEQARVGYLIDDGCSVQEALDGYQDVDFYPDMTLTQLAEQFIDDGLFGEISPAIVNYIDYESIGRDLGLDGYDQTPAGIFRRNS